jgi:3-hydroxy-9,10-secoandrosta-1,3,5(10)-triene-9,17-dione monooxygenase
MKTSDKPDHSTLFASAQNLILTLRDRAAEDNKARQISQATIADFWAAGLFHLLKPAKFNGPEVRPDIVFKIAAILARGDGSAAWVWNVLGMHDLLVALMPLRAQQEYWADDKVLGASSFAANGRATVIPGGFTLSGKWSFCSGVDYADWMMLGAKSNVSVLWMLLPKADCRIVDDWHTLGLRGTGSKSVVVENVFVPDHRTVSYDDLMAGKAPGGAIHESPLYRAPLWPVFTLGICAPAVGIARGACNSFIAEMKIRVYGSEYAMAAKNPAVQLRLAEATALTDAAELLYQRSLTETIDKVVAGQTLTLEERVRSRRDQAYSVEMAKRACELLLSGQGGKGLYETGHVQRAHRDLAALSGHIMAGWDMPALNFGQVALGGPPTDPFY